MNTLKGLILLLLLCLFTKATAQSPQLSTEIYQLREYALQSQHQDKFMSNFRNNTIPIMQRYGFEILNSWTNENTFYYLLKWDSRYTMQKQWERFKEDKDWILQKSLFQQQYGDVVIEINEQVLAKQNYSVQNNGFVNFKIGNIECFALSDGFVSLPAQPSLAPNIPSEVLSNELKRNFRKDGTLDYPINILLLKKESRLILIDAGQGSTNNKDAGKLVSYLASIGVHPLDITDVVISHAHTDHIDGLINSTGNSIYSNADIHLSRVEYEFWQGLDNDFAKSINNVFAVVKKQLILFEDGATIHNCIKNDIVAGHTPGHVVCTIFSKNESLVAINDLVLDALILTHPDWGSGFDSDFEGAIPIRKSYLSKLHETRALIWGSHLPYPGIGNIRKIGKDSYEWCPKFLSYPTMIP
ncbi:MAG: MBL fold metallo-hydrolase [Dysgonamonadaceae bacterium]